MPIVFELPSLTRECRSSFTFSLTDPLLPFLSASTMPYVSSTLADVSATQAMNVSVTLPMICEQVFQDIYVNPPPPRTEEDLQVCARECF